MRKHNALLVAAAMAFASLAQTAIAAPDRVALVIGNGAYTNAAKLINPPNDAADVASALRKLGFDVVEGRDLDKRGMESKVIEFSRKLDRAGMALFFYAGHGMQVGGRNYLVPTDAKLERGGDLSFETLDVSQVLVQMEAEKRVNLVFLDACRDNPLARSLARSLGTRSAVVGQGLASIQGAVGTMIVYATQPDNVALDGDGTRNSPFTAALLKHIATPGLEVRSMMTRVRADVLTATREKQVPWDHSSLTSEVTLTPALSASAISSPSTTAPAGDEIAWSFLKDTTDASQLRRFVEQYPSSTRRIEAVARLQQIEPPKVAALPNAVVPPSISKPTEPVRTSEIVMDRCHTGTSIGAQPVLKKLQSAAECRDSCVRDKECQGWEYYLNSYKSQLPGSPSEMFRKLCLTTNSNEGSLISYKCVGIAAGIVTTETPAIALTIPAPKPKEPARTSQIVEDRCISTVSGNSYAGEVLPTAADCRDSCLKESGCYGWEYISEGYHTRPGRRPSDLIPRMCKLTKQTNAALFDDARCAGLIVGVVETVYPPATANR